MSLLSICGDARAIPLADESVQCVVTSPPYWSLRNYDVENQIGLEATPAEHIAEMVKVFREVHRVLKPDGCIWVNLGDSYAQGGRGPDTRSTLDGSRRNQEESRRAKNGMGIADGLKPKDMVGMPWRIALALQADGWFLRQDIIWSKNNAMPENVHDRPAKSHEYLFLLSKSRHYFYDGNAIKEPVTGNAHARGTGVNPKAKNEVSGDRKKVGLNARTNVKMNASFSAAVRGLVEMRNKRSVWSINSQPFKGSHFATMPEKLVEPCILAGSREGDVVLDVFAGSGTVGRVAVTHRRKAVLLDLNMTYLADLAKGRTSDVQIEMGGLHGA